MKVLFKSKIEACIDLLGLLALSGLYVHWLLNCRANHAGRGMAFLSLLLCVLLCLRFVRQWMIFWSGEEEKLPEQGETLPLWKVAGLSLLAGSLELGLILLARDLMGDSGSLNERLRWFAELDTGNYMDIARFWYSPTAGEERRLVFYPLFPLLTRGLWMLGLDVYQAGTFIALLFFPTSNCLLYRLLCLDYPEKQARGVLKYTLFLPAAFFFVLPMSECCFFFCSLLSMYLARRRAWLPAGFVGALAAFSRSLGVLVFAPLLFEAVAAWIREPKKPGKHALSVACCFLVPMGTLAYLWINWHYYGDPFKFMEMEDQYWSQRMGLFFQTVAYQTDNALADIQTPYYTSSLGIWIPNVLCIMGSLLLLAHSAGKLRASYSLWFIVYFFFAVAPSFLISGPRYLVAAVPLYPALAELGKRKRLATAAAILCAAGELAYLWAFLQGWNVY